MSNGYHIIGYNTDGTSVVAVDSELFNEFVHFLHRKNSPLQPETNQSEILQEQLGMMSIQEFADFMGMHYQTIRAKIVDGTLDAAVVKDKKGGHARIDADQAVQILKRKTGEKKQVKTLNTGTVRKRHTAPSNKAFSLVR